MTTTPMAEKLANADATQRAGSAVEKKQQTIYDEVKAMQGQFAVALGDAITPERFTRVALSMLRDPKRSRAYLRCDRKSILGALMISAQLKLEPGGPLGHAYLVPYGTEVTFIVGYKGYIALALRSGEIASVKATPVYDGDDFAWELGLNETVVHKPTAAVRDDPAKMTHVYAVARFRDKAIDPVFVVLTRAEVDKFRARSKAKDNGPWVTDYVAMAMKTAVRRLSTWLPMAVDVARAAAVDEKPVTRMHIDVDDFIDTDGEEVDLDETAKKGNDNNDPDRDGDGADGAPAPSSPSDGADSHDVGLAGSELDPATLEGAAGAASSPDPAGFDCDHCQGSGREPDDETVVCGVCSGSGSAQ